jgi:hypothetical protein
MATKWKGPEAQGVTRDARESQARGTGRVRRAEADRRWQRVPEEAIQEAANEMKCFQVDLPGYPVAKSLIH